MKRSTWGGSQARIACAGLLLVLLGGLGMVALASAQGLPPPGPRAMPMPGPGAPVLGGLLHCDRLPPELALTAAQQGQLQAIAEGLHADQVQQREADRTLADRWATLLAAQTVDAQAAEALRVQMEQAHDKMSRRLLKATLDAAEVLSRAQRAQLVLLSRAPTADGGHGDPARGPWPDQPGMPPPPHLVP